MGTTTSTTAKPPFLQVPAFDLRDQFKPIKAEVMAALEEVLDAQACVNGPAIAELECDLAGYTQAPYALGCSSGTDALILALMALKLHCGHEIITSPFTFFATAGSLYRQGATPVFVDIEPDTFNLDPTQLQAVLTERTKAIMPVHLFGQTADMDPILDLCKQHNLYCIEDAAQAIGAQSHGRPAGSMGDAAAFSFYPTKNLGGAGDGGLLTTTHEDVYHRAVMFRNHGAQQRYFHEEVGGNFRLDTLQAAYLRVKLKHLESWHDKRNEHAAFYNAAFADLDGLTTPTVRPGHRSVYNQYTVTTKTNADRDALQQYLKDAGVGTAIYYPLGLHEQKCFAHLGYKKGDFPHTEHAAATCLSLPIFPELTDEQRQHVADTVVRFFN
ncbi:MAG: DegT/DnrJ/EryC1/StrS family aminotransferase [Planctomycetota bacterium]